MITIISLTEKVELLPEVIMNWNESPENVRELISSGTDFRTNGQELLILDGRQIIASCTHGFRYDPENDNRFDIVDCWTKEGNIWN